MKNRKQRKPAPASPSETATPFFVRYLEGQDAEPDAAAKVSGRRRAAEARVGSGGSKKSAKKSAAKKPGKAAAAVPLQTLKYPSDRDEYVFYPYKLEAAEATQGFRFATKKFPSDQDEDVTQKYPSDNDDDTEGFYAVYADAADVPRAAAAKPRAAKIALTKKAPKG